jgi:tetrapyrrole methylase family protein / MazG family protein
MPGHNEKTSFDRLKDIIDKLRGPEGCPWDKQQTHDSLKPYLVEECYEVAHAIDEARPPKLREELGDLLLQIMLHSRIADEDGQYNINDVMDGIGDKLVRRHPHVFGGKKTSDLDEINYSWHELKKEEAGKEKSVLSGAPAMMPALAYSQLVQRKVAGVGFDWKITEDILEKLTEEVGELVRAGDKKEKAAEFGDILFVLVNIARRMDIDAEQSLKDANARFFRRFSYMEKLCHERGVNFADLSFDQQNKLWDEAKKELLE